MCPIHTAHARATGKRRAGSLKVQRSHIRFELTFASNSTNARSLSTTNHPRAWTVPTSAERLCVWTSPQETTTLGVLYGESYAHIAIIHCTTAVLPSCKQSIHRAVHDLLSENTRKGMWLLGHNQWGRSRSPKMRGIALVNMYCVILCNCTLIS